MSSSAAASCSTRSIPRLRSRRPRPGPIPTSTSGPSGPTVSCQQAAVEPDDPNRLRECARRPSPAACSRRSRSSKRGRLSRTARRWIATASASGSSGVGQLKERLVPAGRSPTRRRTCEGRPRPHVRRRGRRARERRNPRGGSGGRRAAEACRADPVRAGLPRTHPRRRRARRVARSADRNGQATELRAAAQPDGDHELIDMDVQRRARLAGREALETR